MLNAGAQAQPKPNAEVVYIRPNAGAQAQPKPNAEVVPQPHLNH